MDVHGDEWSLNFLTPDDNTHIHHQNNKINGEQTFDKAIHLCQNYVVVEKWGKLKRVILFRWEVKDLSNCAQIYQDTKVCNQRSQK